jgi:hypothetical protein
MLHAVCFWACCPHHRAAALMVTHLHLFTVEHWQQQLGLQQVMCCAELQVLVFMIGGVVFGAWCASLLHALQCVILQQELLLAVGHAQRRIDLHLILNGPKNILNGPKNKLHS